MSIIFNKIEASYTNNLPFVAYRKPNSDQISAFLMQDTDVYFTSDFSEEGFVFAPFNDKEKAILFPKEKAIFIKEMLANNIFFENKTIKNNVVADKEAHFKLVEKSLQRIYKEDFKKVVISRKETIELQQFTMMQTFKKMLHNYTNAFVYCWFHPKVGLWFGATPETLLYIDKNKFTTMSLAGTQVYKGENNVVWGGKELEEQQLVTDFIANQLKTITSNLNIDKTETVKAGNLLHLKTKVTGNLLPDSNLKDLIRSLHPTPAVCGLPREITKAFIIKNENYSRSFYTGFLGELNQSKTKTALFVNLRCMSVKDNKASIYVGGGITKDSEPEKEWLETVSKSKTMSRIL